MHKVVYLHISNVEHRSPIAAMIVVPEKINLFNPWFKFRNANQGEISRALLEEFIVDLERNHGVLRISEMTTIGVKA